MSQPDGPRVVLVHGLLNAEWWLRPLAARLRAQGFRTELFGYSSVFDGPERAVPRLLERLRKEPADALVGHSLGGLIALESLRQAPELAVSRVVCLGSPLRGSQTARNLATRGWGRPLLGRSAGLLQCGLECWDGTAQVGLVAGDVARGLGRLLRVSMVAPTVPLAWRQPGCPGWPTIAPCTAATAGWCFRQTPCGRPRISSATAGSSTPDIARTRQRGRRACFAARNPTPRPPAAAAGPRAV